MNFRNRYNQLRSTVVEMGKELQANDNHFFFPVPFIVDILTRFCLSNSINNIDNTWVMKVLTDAGVSHAAVIDAVASLAHKMNSTAEFLRVVQILAESIDVYYDFIVHYNIDPIVKRRFLASVDQYLTLLKDLKKAVEEVQDEQLKNMKQETVRIIKKVHDEVERQKKREESVLYAQMLI